MEERECRNCGRTADVGVYCQRCAADIMAKALKPHFSGRRKKVHRPVSAASSVQPRLIG